MRVPLSLLSKMVSLPKDGDGFAVDELAEKMNGRVSEIEHIHRFPSRQAFAGVQVVRLISMVEETQDYQRWAASAGGKNIHMVVGRKYGVQAGQAFAGVLDGDTLPDGTPVSAREVGGLASDGLLLSEVSAGVGADAGNPLGFGPDVQDGANAWDTLGLDDVVLEFDLEPNRSDLFSLVGMARDVSAIYGTPLCHPTLADISEWGSSELKIDLQTDACTRYAAVELSGVGAGPSPQWLQNAVRKLGMRPINQIVDAANLAMFELGQPMHTFDRAHISSGSIGLRMARPDEKITTLDGVERTLTDECLLVTDGETPVALAGIMGDAHSEIGADSKSIVIESAHFDMFTVRRASRRLALRTEASVRFEKGLAPSRVLPGMQRLVQILKELGEEVQVNGWVDAWPSPPAQHLITFDASEARARLGMDVPNDTIQARFAALGHKVQVDSPTQWQVAVAPWRPDLLIQADLNEEVGRIHGYEHVVSELPSAALQPPVANPVFSKGFAARDTLNGLGFDEVYLGVWVGQEQLERFSLRPETLIRLTNPLHSHLEYFRPSALPDLVSAVRENRKSLASFKLFELAKVYGKINGQAEDRNHLSGVVAGAGNDDSGDRFFQARDAALDVLVGLGLAPEIRVGDAPAWALSHCFHPGRQALISLQGKVVGFVGELHPGLVTSLGLSEPFSSFHIDFESVMAMTGERVSFTPPPRFPGMKVHVNVLAPARMLAKDLLQALDGAALERQVGRSVLDVYAGKGVPEGQKRVTVELEFNHPERSLRSEEVEGWIQSLKGHLASQDLVAEV